MAERAAPSTLQPAFLTTREMADLLRVRERRVYDLAAAGEVPCSRVTGKLLFPREAIEAWLRESWEGGPGARPRPAVVLGSHDPLLDWALRESGSGLAAYVDGSRDGLARFEAREGVATGLHLFDAASGDWNRPFVEQAGRGAVLVGFCRRRRGLIVPRETDAPSALADLAGRRVVRRQEASGAEALFRHLCAEAGLDPDARDPAAVARTEADAALAVAEGRAEAAFGLEALARPFGLGFHPLVEEPFDLLVDRAAWFEAPMQRLTAFCASPAFAERANALAGYDVAEFGLVRWNAPD
ncbi:MAG: substrate-binding domain-containing protein [Paracoccaceae bacterium]